MGAASDASEAASAPTWAQAVERLSAIGVADARWAIRQARANGLTPQTVLGLADFFQSQPGRWGLGALHYRIRAQLEGAAIDLHWPPPSPDWQRSKAREDAPNRRERERQLWRREQVEDGEPSARSLLDELRAIQPPKSEEARGDG